MSIIAKANAPVGIRALAPENLSELKGLALHSLKNELIQDLVESVSSEEVSCSILLIIKVFNELEYIQLAELLPEVKLQEQNRISGQLLNILGFF